MAVAFDAKMTAGNAADGFSNFADNATSNSSSGLTIGSSASLLIATIVHQRAGSVTGLAMTWNGVSMSLQANTSVSAGAATLYASTFTLVNPATGNKTLAASWTGIADCYMSGVSFTGTDTTTGVNTGDNTTATNTTSIAVPTDSNGATVAVFVVNGSTPTMNFTTLWGYSALDPGGGSNYTTGGSGTNSHTFTGAGGTNQALAGVHVIAAAITSSGMVIGNARIPNDQVGPMALRRFRTTPFFPGTAIQTAAYNRRRRVIIGS